MYIEIWSHRIISHTIYIIMFGKWRLYKLWFWFFLRRTWIPKLIFHQKCSINWVRSFVRSSVHWSFYRPIFAITNIKWLVSTNIFKWRSWLFRGGGGFFGPTENGEIRFTERLTELSTNLTLHNIYIFSTLHVHTVFFIWLFLTKSFALEIDYEHGHGRTHIHSR